MKEIEEASAGRTVSLLKGEQMRVTLRETAGTGFRWSEGGACGAVLHLDEERAVPPKDAAPGAAGTRVWLYTATETGRCELKFVLTRSWEKAGSGRTVIFPVAVGGAA